MRNLSKLIIESSVLPIDEAGTVAVKCAPKNNTKPGGKGYCDPKRMKADFSIIKKNYNMLLSAAVDYISKYVKKMISRDAEEESRIGKYLDKTTLKKDLKLVSASVSYYDEKRNDTVWTLEFDVPEYIDKHHVHCMYVLVTNSTKVKIDSQMYDG
jgi:hypothetical protein